MDVLLDELLKMVPLNAINLLMAIANFAALWWGVRPLLRTLAGRLDETNDSVTVLREWRTGHDKQDDERYQDLKTEIHGLRQRV